MGDEPRRRPGPIYDDAMKILADDDLDALLSVVGVPSGARRLNAELAASTMKADLLAQNSAGIVHVEFVKDPTPDLALRMVEYRLRLRRRHRYIPITQFVLVLPDVPVPSGFDDGDLTSTWSVVRVGDLDPQALLATPTTAAIAALARGTPDERGAVLSAAVDVIASRVDPDRRNLLLGVATTLASIVLPAGRIDAALKEATMPVPVRDTPLGRELVEEGLEQGLEQGLERGRQEGELRAVLRLTRMMLVQRFGDGPRIDAVAELLVALPDEERLFRMAQSSSLAELDGE